ncbi:MAG: hypothetical protein JWM77_834 [Rhodospirillales bacterium]|nr:hypothetical protein [Rhodospirillales bacterium]
MRRDGVEKFPAAWLLLPLAAFWVTLLLAHPGLPRNDAPSWAMWFDQSHYLDQALQMARGAIDPDRFFYPPLYPALGALAIKLGTPAAYAFEPVDLVCFLIFALAFVRTAERFVPPVVAVALFAASVCARPIAEHWIVPWTTTPAATLLALLVYATCAARVRPIVIGLLVGMLVATRPLEAVPAACLVLVRLPALLRQAEAPRLATLAKLALGACVPVLALAAFDLAIWNDALGGYYRAQDGAAHVALMPMTAFAKFVTLWIDGSRFGLPHETLLAHEPWLFLGLAGCALAIVSGSNALAAIAVALLVHALAYASYVDLTPANLFRFGVVHYFKWTYPYFALLAVAAPFAVWRHARIVPGAVAILLAVLLGCAGWHARSTPVAATVDESVLRIALPAHDVDAVDLDGVSLRSFTWDVAGAAKDGVLLPPRRALHGVAWPDHARLVLVRPLRDGELTVPLDQVELRGTPAARAQRNRLGLRWPVWLQQDDR